MRRLALPLLLALAACGQKGNLYLPDDAAESVPVSTSPASTGPAAAASPESPAPQATPPGQDPDPDKPARRN